MLIRRALLRVLLSALLSALPATLPPAAAADVAAAEDGWAPEPFTASYRARYDGVPFSARGRRVLVRGADGTLHFSSDLRTFLLRLTEEAEMELAPDGELRPLHYAYRQRGIGGRRDRYLEFDWQEGEVRRSGDKERVEALGDHWLDPVSWQLALRRDVSRGRLRTGGAIEYPITDGGEPKIYHIEHRGPDRIDLPAGTFETVVLERRFEAGDPRETRIWLAPAFGFMLVRLEAVDDSGRMLRLELVEAPDAGELRSSAG